MIYLSSNPNRIIKAYNVSGVEETSLGLINLIKDIDNKITPGIKKEKYKNIMCGNRYLYRQKETELTNSDNDTTSYIKEYNYPNILGEIILCLKDKKLDINLTDFVAQFPFDPIEKISMLEILYEKLDPDIFLNFLKENFISLYLYSYFADKLVFKLTDTYDLDILKNISKTLKYNESVAKLIKKFPTANANYRIHVLSKRIGKSFPIE